MIVLLKKYWLSILVLLTIFILCLMDTSSLPAQPVVNFDKLVHSLMFSGLSGVIFFDATSYLRFPISKKRIFWGVFLFPLVIGGLTEILQASLPINRTGDWFDFLFNAIGIVFGTGVALLINNWLILRKKY